MKSKNELMEEIIVKTKESDKVIYDLHVLLRHYKETGVDDEEFKSFVDNISSLDMNIWFDEYEEKDYTEWKLNEKAYEVCQKNNE